MPSPASPSPLAASLPSVAYRPHATLTTNPEQGLPGELAVVQANAQTIYAILLVLSLEPQDILDADDMDYIERRVNAILAVANNPRQIVVAILLYCEIVGRLEAIAEHHNCLLLKELPDTLRFLRERTSGSTGSP